MEAGDTVPDGPRHWASRLPFYYGWVIVAVAFVTMAFGVSARTAFSLLLPPLIEEFGWERGVVAGAFSFGFLVSAVLSPFVGRAMDRRGPRIVIGAGVCMVAGGLLAAPVIEQPWQLYATLGVLVGAGANLMSFTAQSLYLPNWFVRRRGLAMSISFAGVGAGAVVLLPWLQEIIGRDGWRAACRAMGLSLLFIVGPLTLLVRGRPQEVGALPDGAPVTAAAGTARAPNVVDPAWASVEWTLARAVRTGRFWWLALAYFCGLFAWYAVQVHQTKYLVEVGFSPARAAWALGLVAVVAVPGQIGLGALSDRVGREWVWSAGCLGFAVCYAALIGLAACRIEGTQIRQDWLESGMSNFIPFNREQSFLLPPDLKEWLPPDDVAHFIVAAVDRVPLSSFQVPDRPGGKPQYHPRLMLALLIYGYANGIFSSRRIERASYRDIGVRFVAANLHPDHDTIAVFRRANRAAFEAAFLQVLLLARESGLLHLGTVSIDGTKIDANASKIRSVRYDRGARVARQAGRRHRRSDSQGGGGRCRRCRPPGAARGTGAPGSAEGQTGRRLCAAGSRGEGASRGGTSGLRSQTGEL